MPSEGVRPWGPANDPTSSTPGGQAFGSYIEGTALPRRLAPQIDDLSPERRWASAPNNCRVPTAHARKSLGPHIVPYRRRGPFTCLQGEERIT